MSEVDRCSTKVNDEGRNTYKKAVKKNKGKLTERKMKPREEERVEEKKRKTASRSE